MVAVLGRPLASADMREIARVVYLCRVTPAAVRAMEFGLQAADDRALAEATAAPGGAGTRNGWATWAPSPGNCCRFGVNLRVLEYDRLYVIAALSGSGAGRQVAWLAELLRQPLP